MELLLRKGEMLALENNRCGHLVQCGDGILWITQEGDWRDHFLHRGESFESLRPGRIVISALADCRLHLAQEPAAKSARADRPFRLSSVG
jgi:hypothetical protein